MQNIVYSQIGIINSPHEIPEQTPAQTVYAKGIKGTVEIDSKYSDGLADLDGFSHIYLIYHFHKSTEVKLTVKPFLDNTYRGLFSTRTPWRPNPLGFSIVKLLKREENILYIEDVDILNGTPLLDIKPYVHRFDRIDEVKCGWQDKIDEKTAQIRGKRNYKNLEL